MDKVIIADIGVEGGGVTIFGKNLENVWSFWTEVTSMDLDENDDEVWRSSAIHRSDRGCGSDPVMERDGTALAVAARPG